jgi:hypothetical protein
MRVGFVNRTDLSKGLYISDVENSSQRNFSSEPPGQSRIIRRPTDAELLVPLAANAALTVRGSDTNAAVDTTVANGTKLNIRTSASAQFTQVTVTSNAALPKTQIVSELNTAFRNAGLGLVARISGTNQLTIDTTEGGPNAYVEISAASPSAGALHTVVGLAAAATTGITLAAWRAAVYPTAVTIDISTATILALSTFSLLQIADQTALVEAVQDVIAPEFIETGAALLSFAYGILGKAADSTFQPGGARIGLTAGPALAVLQDDGVTVFTL